MKQKMKFTLIALMCLLGTYGMSQQEYTISFDQTMETEDTLMQQTLEMMGEMSTVWYINESKFRSETNAGMTGTTTVIYDGKTKDILMLMESPFMGNSYISISDTLETDELEPTIVKTKEKKKIAGYKCVKYLVTDASGQETILYATDKIKNPFNKQYGAGVEGAVLCSISEMDNMGAKIKVTMIATEVKIGKISEDKFDMSVPEGYTEFDMEEN